MEESKNQLWTWCAIHAKYLSGLQNWPLCPNRSKVILLWMELWWGGDCGQPQKRVINIGHNPWVDVSCQNDVCDVFLLPTWAQLWTCPNECFCFRRNIERRPRSFPFCFLKCTAEETMMAKTSVRYLPPADGLQACTRITGHISSLTKLIMPLSERCQRGQTSHAFPDNLGTDSFDWQVITTDLISVNHGKSNSQRVPPNVGHIAASEPLRSSWFSTVPWWKKPRHYSNRNGSFLSMSNVHSQRKMCGNFLLWCARGFVVMCVLQVMDFWQEMYWFMRGSPDAQRPKRHYPPPSRVMQTMVLLDWQEDLSIVMLLK